MKKAAAMLALMVFGMNTRAQNVMDTARQHEISLSFLPVFSLFTGGYQANTYSNFNLSYKYYFKKKYALRTALVFFPGSGVRYDNGIPQFYKAVDTMNYFRIPFTSGNKIQLNVGAERLYAKKYLIHGLGADLWVNREWQNYQEDYFRVGNTQAQQDPFMFILPEGKNRVDSMSKAYKAVGTGVGLQVFYSLRFRLSEHFYLSSTIGPYLNLSFREFTSSNISKFRKGSTVNSADLNSIWVSDLSIAYRF